MSDQDWLASEFEANRPHLRAVAYRMLGSVSEAEDAVQEAWLRLSRGYTESINNLGGWLTTVVGRVSLDMLKARKVRREDLSGRDSRVPDPIVNWDPSHDPASRAELADSVGLALMVVLDRLDPAERLAFVLHDVFAVPFQEIAPMVERTPTATRQLASRARRRVQGSATAPDPNLARQRAVVDAFVSASQGGDFEALLAVLDPNVVMRLDRGAVPVGASKIVRGAEPVIAQGFSFSGAGWTAKPAVVNGGAGLIVSRAERTFAVVGFTVTSGRIAAIDILADPQRLRALR